MLYLLSSFTFSVKRTAKVVSFRLNKKLNGILFADSGPYILAKRSEYQNFITNAGTQRTTEVKADTQRVG